MVSVAPSGMSSNQKLTEIEALGWKYMVGDLLLRALPSDSYISLCHCMFSFIKETKRPQRMCIRTR